MGKYSRRIKITNGKKATVPIKNPKEIDNILQYFLSKRDNAKSKIKQQQADRNYMLCLMGFNTAFRGEDLLQLLVKDVENGYISIKENKTGKFQNFKMTTILYDRVKEYVERNDLKSNDYLFFGQKTREMAITIQQADRILSDVAKAIRLKSNFSMHSMRKTFGYMHHKKGGSIMTLMKMYNHTSPAVTMLYICWNTEDAENDRQSNFIGK